MRSCPEIIKKARVRVLKYLAACIAIVLVLAVLIGFIVNRCSNLIVELTYFAAVAIVFVASRIFYKNFILNILYRDLDAEVFMEVLRRYKLDLSSAVYRLDAEYFTGNYKNVVSVCKTNLASEDLTPKHVMFYNLNLTMIYFDIGDTENLKSAYNAFCNAFDQCAPKTQAKLKKFWGIMDFYGAYLNGDIDFCKAWLEIPVNNNLARYTRTFLKARLAFLTGDEQTAKELYTKIKAEIPSLNYGILASVYLSVPAEEAKVSNPSLFDIYGEPTELNAFYYPRKIKYWRLGLLLAAIICICFLVLGEFEDRPKDFGEYGEQVVALFERDYDNVELIELISVEKDAFVVETLGVFKTDTDVIVCSLYTYEGVSETLYTPQVTVPISALTTGKARTQKSFWATTSDYNITLLFCNEKSEIPHNHYGTYSFKLNGERVYLTVSELLPTKIVATD